MASKVIIDWVYKPRPTAKPEKEMWLSRMMDAVGTVHKTLPWVTIYEIKTWCAQNDFKFSHGQVDQFCNDNGLVVHSWGPSCVYFKKAVANGSL